MVKASAEDLARFEELLDVVEGADRKLVFGSPTCLVGGNMFFGVHSCGLFVKLPPEIAQALLAGAAVVRVRHDVAGQAAEGQALNDEYIDGEEASSATR